MKEFEYDNRFGAADIETFSEKCGDVEGRQIPYAAGFKDYKGVVKMFYVEDNEERVNPISDGVSVIIRMIDDLLSDVVCVLPRRPEPGEAAEGSREAGVGQSQLECRRPVLLVGSRVRLESDDEREELSVSGASHVAAGNTRYVACLN